MAKLVLGSSVGPPWDVRPRPPISFLEVLLRDKTRIARGLYRHGMRNVEKWGNPQDPKFKVCLQRAVPGQDGAN